METTLVRKITITKRDRFRLEFLLLMNGFRDYSINYQSGKKAILTFNHEEDLTAFMLMGILEKLNDNKAFYSPEPEIDFMIRLEKKMKTYSKCDEYLYRKMHGT